MGRKHYVLLAAALVAGFGGGALSGGLRTPVVAGAGAPPRAYEDQRWEYCVVTKAQYLNSNRGGYWVGYFQGSSVRVENIETGVSGSAFARAVAKLGDEGWEMIGEGPLEVRAGVPGGTPTALYFKRRKE